MAAHAHRRTSAPASAANAARAVMSRLRNMLRMCGASTIGDTSPLKRVTAGRSGNATRSSPLTNRSWYSSLPAGGWCGNAVSSASPARCIGSTCQVSDEGYRRQSTSTRTPASFTTTRTGWSSGPPWLRSRRRGMVSPARRTSPLTG